MSSERARLEIPITPPVELSGAGATNDPPRPLEGSVNLSQNPGPPDQASGTARMEALDKLIERLTIAAEAIAKLADSVNRLAPATLESSARPPSVQAGDLGGVDIDGSAAPEEHAAGRFIRPDPPADSQAAPQRNPTAAASNPDFSGALNPADAIERAIQSMNRLTQAYVDGFDRMAEQMDKAVQTINQRLNGLR